MPLFSVVAMVRERRGLLFVCMRLLEFRMSVVRDSVIKVNVLVDRACLSFET